METLIKLQVIWRICWRVALFAIVGAVLVGPVSAFLMALYIFPQRPFAAAICGVFYGAFCLGLAGFLTAKRRDTCEELKMAIGGAWLGIVNCTLWGSATFCIAVFFLHVKYLAIIYSLFILMGALNRRTLHFVASEIQTARRTVALI